MPAPRDARSLVLYHGPVDEPVVLRSFWIEDLDAATRASIMRVCVVAHDNEGFNNLFSYLPAGARHVVAHRGEEVLSHAVCTTRWLQPAGLSILKTAFVDAVATLPAHQGLGLGSAVMRRLADEMQAEFMIGCLQTERESFYRRLDWESWRGPLAGRDGEDLIPTPEQGGVMVLRLAATPAIELDAMLTIECQSNRIWN